MKRIDVLLAGDWINYMFAFPSESKLNLHVLGELSLFVNFIGQFYIISKSYFNEWTREHEYLHLKFTENTKGKDDGLRSSVRAGGMAGDKSCRTRPTQQKSKTLTTDDDRINNKSAACGGINKKNNLKKSWILFFIIIGFLTDVTSSEIYTGYGTFNVRMALYYDETFTNYYTDEIPILSTRDTMYLGVSGFIYYIVLCMMPLYFGL